MLRKFLIAVAVLAALGGIAFWLLTIPQTVPATALGPHQADLANGRTMFIAGGCSGCHASPGVEDKTQLGGGLALKSPFGTFYVPNISPDRRDGIGAWSEQDFVNAVSRGTSRDGQHYYPAFPYTSYQRMRLDDLRDLFAYLKTLPPVSGKVRDHDMAFPFGFRRGLGLWKLLYVDGERFKPDPAKSAALNRGAYLVEGPGHCAECHSPRNLIGGIIAAQRFAGGPNPEGKGWIPNITPKGIGEWSEKDIAYLLESGQTLDGDAVGGSMAEVVRNTEQLAAEDRTAIAAYIKSLPAVEGPKPTKK
jgi:mono/diheme cytochrome c family protein